MGLSVVVDVLVVDAAGVVEVVALDDAAGVVEVVDLAVVVDLSFLAFLSLFVFVVLVLVSDFGASALAAGRRVLPGRLQAWLARLNWPGPSGLCPEPTQRLRTKR